MISLYICNNVDQALQFLIGYKYYFKIWPFTFFKWRSN